MKCFSIISLAIIAGIPCGYGQPAPAAARVTGTVTAVKAPEKQVQITSDKGESLTLNTTDRSFVLRMPSLRERKEDVVPLALDFIGQFNKDLKKSFIGFTPAAAELLKNYPWPGNIRELRNVIERTMILCKETEIDAADLPEEVRDHEASSPQVEPLSAYDLSPTGDQFVTLSELEDHYIQDVLNATGQNKTHAARILEFILPR